MIHRDAICGGVLIGICGGVYWLTTGFDQAPSMLSQNVPPTFFPRLVLAATVVLSVLLVALSARRPASEAAPVGGVVFATAVMVIAAPLAVGIIGTWLTLAIIAVGLPALWGERRWFLIGSLAVALPIFVYLVFALALDVRFPAGMLFSLWG